jgi:hypothetical protein
MHVCMYAFVCMKVGEYSLATDSCAMFLNGFNDAPGGYPVVSNSSIS